jgi:acylphosphatase
VEVHAAGPARVLEEFEGLLGEGPPVAVVTKLEAIEPDAGMSHSRFEITLK